MSTSYVPSIAPGLLRGYIKGPPYCLVYGRYEVNDTFSPFKSYASLINGGSFSLTSLRLREVESLASDHTAKRIQTQV